MMLRKIRLTFAILFFTVITLLFLDFTGTLHAWFGWMAKIQFLPALLALNVGVVLLLVVLTLLVGRVYCSPALSGLRYTVLGLFVVALIAGVGSVVALLAPYSSYGRIASNLFAPLYGWVNNGLAYLAERADSYAFYETTVWLKSLPTFLIALLTFVVLIILAWKNGRTYCNTICPVGSVLGFLSKFALFRVTIDADKCKSCSLCTRQCKAACIDYKNHQIDYSRCVACMDCIDTCKHDAIRLQSRLKKPQTAAQPTDNNRRNFLTATALLATTATLKAQEKKVDGGLAVIEDKKVPDRQTPILPAGALSARHFAQHCTACQLCVSVCPNEVLRPSTSLLKLMQPEMSYERGYCRPECTKCADVCPAGAIRPITVADKSATRLVMPYGSKRIASP